MSINTSESKITFTQDDDSYISTKKGYQQLDISLEDAGGGLFFSIKTERWAFDDIEELISKLRISDNLRKSLKEDTEKSSS